MKGKINSKEHNQNISKAHKGRIISKETRRKMSVAAKGRTFTTETLKKMAKSRKHMSEETHKKLRDSHKGFKHSKKTLKKMSAAQKGRIISKEARQKMSATKQGISYEEWEFFAKEQPYCPAFNESCRESNRDKYNRECFICGLPECENITSTNISKKLSVHHCDMDRGQGCDGKRWKLVPLCLHCHSKVHSDLWNDRIAYLLNV